MTTHQLTVITVVEYRNGTTFGQVCFEANACHFGPCLLHQSDSEERVQSNKAYGNEDDAVVFSLPTTVSQQSVAIDTYEKQEMSDSKPRRKIRVEEGGNIISSEKAAT